MIKILTVAGAITPTLGIACVFLWPVVTGVYLPGTDVQSLGYVMQLEWFAMVSGIFLICPLMMEGNLRGVQIFRMVLFAFFALFWASFVYQAWGLNGVFGYMVLVYLSYGGITIFSKDGKTRHMRTYLAAGRWVIYLAIFFTFVVVYDLGGSIMSWDGKLAAVHLGASFFGIMVIFEAMLIFITEKWLDPYQTRLESMEHSSNDTIAARQRYNEAIMSRSRNPGQD